MGANLGKMKKHQAAKTKRAEGRDTEGKKYSNNVSQCLHRSRCDGCERRERRIEEYTEIGKGRKLCTDCHVHALVDEEDLESCFDYVKKFFTKNNLILEGTIHVYPVYEDELHPRNGQKLVTNTRYDGLTTMRTGHIRVVTGYWETEAGKLEVVTKVKKLPSTRKKRKCSILILYGLPWLRAGVTMAHEMLHAWFFQQGLYHLDSEVNEGFCELIAYLWLSEQPIAEHDEYVRNLRHSLFREIRHQSGVYGSGFRKAKAAFEKFNNDLEATIRAVCSCKNFPS